MRARQYPKRAVVFAAVIQMQPDMAVAHEQLGLALAKSHDLPDAVAECRIALFLDPRSARARAFLAKAATIHES